MSLKQQHNLQAKRLCIDCKNFICRFNYGYAKEDNSYITIHCGVVIRNKNPSAIDEHIWDITEKLGWVESDFRKAILTAKNCEEYIAIKD